MSSIEPKNKYCISAKIQLFAFFFYKFKEKGYILENIVIDDYYSDPLIKQMFYL